ncbi:hypothetical protein [Paenibacillus sp. YPG26]|uniref:hypothetical protein n=1 Tax=Paenibacillus sp. YPG26 TaxID=2878915 RepID=UPI00203A7BAA|nr:hypothetical protein [Paenibacillus sp. YPG26]USB33561.1 hypothetical protein LDO05_01655 [Paenibacillus sp. YPG26]
MYHHSPTPHLSEDHAILVTDSMRMPNLEFRWAVNTGVCSTQKLDFGLGRIFPQDGGYRIPFVLS